MDLLRKLCLVAYMILLGHICRSTSDAQTMAPSNGVEIQATPLTFFEGLTRHLTVTCSFPGGADISDVMSLIMSKTSASQSVYTEVAAVTSHAPGHVDVKDPSLNATVTGHLHAQDSASLSLSWAYPSNQVAGSFKCQLFGMDVAGHPRLSTAETSVEALDDVTTDLLVKEINALHDSHDVLVKGQTDLNTRLVDLESFKAKTTNAVFETSTTFNGHTYWLSNPFMRDIANHYMLCKVFGGYIVEIDDKAEYDFIYDWAIVQNKVDKVAIGSTDAVRDGTWAYIRTGKTMTYIHKTDGTGATSDNVLEIWSEFHGMVDEPSQGLNHRRELLGRFICEIPN